MKKSYCKTNPLFLLYQHKKFETILRHGETIDLPENNPENII